MLWFFAYNVEKTDIEYSRSASSEQDHKPRNLKQQSSIDEFESRTSHSVIFLSQIKLKSLEMTLSFLRNLRKDVRLFMVRDGV